MDTFETCLKAADGVRSVMSKPLPDPNLDIRHGLVSSGASRGSESR
jgi:hypothetical protein